MNMNSIVVAIAKSIELRNNAEGMTRKEVMPAVVELASYGIFSARQIEKICQKKVSHSTISRAVLKTRKFGGKLNPVDLELIRSVIFQKSTNNVDWSSVAKITSNGTSPEMLEKLTGISATQIRRKTAGVKPL